MEAFRAKVEATSPRFWNLVATLQQSRRDDTPAALAIGLFGNDIDLLFCTSPRVCT